MAKTSDLWNWGSDRNPYLHNVFAILGLDDPDAPSPDYDDQVAMLMAELQIRQPEAVHGHVPTQVDLAKAQDMARDTNRLSEERLLVHRLHGLDLNAFDEFIRFFEDAARRAGDDAERLLPLPLTNVAPIVRWLPPVGEISASMVGPPDVSTLLPLLEPDPAEERVLPV